MGDYYYKPVFNYYRKKHDSRDSRDMSIVLVKLNFTWWLNKT